MTKYIKPEIDIKYFVDSVQTIQTTPSPLSEIYAAGSTNSVILNGAKGQRTTTADIKDVIKFK